MGDDGGGSAGPSRMLWLWQNLIGQVVTIELVDGTAVEGLLMAKNRDSMGVVLAHSRRVGTKKTQRKEKSNTQSSTLIEANTIVKITATGVQLEHTTVKGVNDPGRVVADRTLERWEGGVDEALCLEDNKGYTTGEFDQFKANEKMGYVSTYDETVYTTKLDKNSLTAEQIRKAELQAAEIERNGRGATDCIAWADDIDDEEAQHSSVIREADPVSVAKLQNTIADSNTVREILGGGGGSSYIPPHLRSRGGEDPPLEEVNGQIQTPNQTDGQKTTTSATLNPHVPINPPPAAQYRQDGPLQLRLRDGTPPQPGTAVLPPDCYNVENQPSPPPPQQQAQQPEEKKKSPTIPASSINKKLITPKPTPNVKPGISKGSPTLPRATTENAAVSRKQEIAAFKKVCFVL